MKFNQYLYLKKFKLITDHKPLLTIFGENKSIPQFSANRLRRWAVILSGYNYEIEYVKSKKNYADWLSRMPSSAEDDFLDDDHLDISYCYFFKNNVDINLDFRLIQKHTASDSVLQKVISFINNGWPRKCKDSVLKPYFAKRFDFYIRDNCIMWNHKIIIPQALQPTILNKLHESHMGAVKMKSLARGYFWFPNLNLHIEDLVKKCEACIMYSSSSAKSQICPWPWPNAPWERIHVDFCELNRKNYLVILDAYSKWIEAFEMTNITTTLTIQCLRRLFATFGLPLVLV